MRDERSGSSRDIGDLGQTGLDGDHFAHQIDQLIQSFRRHPDAGGGLGGGAFLADLLDMLLFDQGRLHLFRGDDTLVHQKFAQRFLLLQDLLQLVRRQIAAFDQDLAQLFVGAVAVRLVVVVDQFDGDPAIVFDKDEDILDRLLAAAGGQDDIPVEIAVFADQRHQAEGPGRSGP